MENGYKSNQKDPARSKILLFVIGVLLGAVISTTAFLIYAKTLGVASTSSDNQSSQQQMQGGTPPEMPSGENGQGGGADSGSSDNSNQ